MIIDLAGVTVTGTSARLCASVRWEQTDRADLQLSIETSDTSALLARLDAFLPLCAIVAQLTGEQRVASHDPVSPLLKEGLPTALAWSRHLSGADRPPLVLDLPVDTTPVDTRPARHGLFFSGGVDSLATLIWNLRNTPPGHVHRVRDLVFVQGFEEQSSARARDAVAAIADETGLGLLEVTTNLAALDTPDRTLWQRYLYGAYLGSVAQALAGRFTRMTIAPSSGRIGPVKRVGSLPQLDTNLSSDRVTVGHPHFETSRDDRIAAIAGWAPARRWLRPCSKNAGQRLNCGVCEKCVPTQVALLAAGHDLADFEAFPTDDLDPAAITRLRVFERELVDIMADDHAPALRRRGRHDLADAIDRLREGFMTWEAWRAAAIREVAGAVTGTAALQVVDLGQFDLPDPLAGHELRPHWWVGESPADFRDAVRHHRSSRADHLIFFSSAYWMFDHYPWLDPLLGELGVEVAHTERTRVVKLA